MYKSQVNILGDYLNATGQLYAAVLHNMQKSFRDDIDYKIVRLLNKSRYLLNDYIIEKFFDKEINVKEDILKEEEESVFEKDNLIDNDLINYKYSCMLKHVNTARTIICEIIEAEKEQNLKLCLALDNTKQALTLIVKKFFNSDFINGECFECLGETSITNKEQSDKEIKNNL